MPLRLLSRRRPPSCQQTIIFADLSFEQRRLKSQLRQRQIDDANQRHGQRWQNVQEYRLSCARMGQTAQRMSDLTVYPWVPDDATAVLCFTSIVGDMACMKSIGFHYVTKIAHVPDTESKIVILYSKDIQEAIPTPVRLPNYGSFAQWWQTLNRQANLDLEKTRKATAEGVTHQASFRNDILKKTGNEAIFDVYKQWTKRLWESEHIRFKAPVKDCPPVYTGHSGALRTKSGHRQHRRPPQTKRTRDTPLCCVQKHFLSRF